MSVTLPDKLVVLTEPEAAYALREAWKSLFGAYPSTSTWAILFAQTCLETGRYKKGLHNYNFGNVKAASNYEGYIQFFRVSEIIAQKEVWFEPPHPQTRFRAYLNAVDGATDYLRFLQGPRYAKALEYLKKGDCTSFTIALSSAHYFTASLTKYLKDMNSICNEFKRRLPEFMAYTPNDKKDTLPAIPGKLPAPPKVPTFPESSKEKESISSEEPKKSVETAPPIVLSSKPELKKEVSQFKPKLVTTKNATIAGIIVIVLSWLFAFFTSK